MEFDAFFRRKSAFVLCAVPTAQAMWKSPVLHCGSHGLSSLDTEPRAEAPTLQGSPESLKALGVHS